MMIVILNVLWLVLGGFHAALGWFLSSAVLVLTVVGIPWARSAFNIGLLTLWPFGSDVRPREDLTGVPDLGTGSFGVVGNILWALFAGWWLFIVHVFYAALLALTIVGIPFAVQHWKLAKLAFFPVGKAIELDVTG
jgi:uncharacterized membrane protein YccF (DUF307 family)